MKIEHVAIWTTALERMKRFYETYFNASADPGYENEKKAVLVLLSHISHRCAPGDYVAAGCAIAH